MIVRKIEEFARQNPGAQKIINSLGNNAAFMVRVKPEGMVSFRKIKGQLELLTSESACKGIEYDLEVTVPEVMIEDFFAANPQKADEIIIFFAENYHNPKYREDIDLKIFSGVLKLTMKGYMALVPLGGHALMSILKSKGFGSISSITSALKGIINK